MRAPGRLELLGGHVDYSEGWVLPCAIEPALELAASACADRRLVLELPDLGASVTLELDRLPPPVPERREQCVAAGDFAAGIAWAFRRAGHALAGASITVRSAIPIGAGVSSSAAFEVATALALAQLGGCTLDPLEVAQIGRTCENAYLGLGSGIMDQYACLFGVAGCALLLDCRTLTHRTIPRPPGVRFLIADSGVRRRLVESGYGDRAAECARALELLRRDRPELRTLRDLPASGLETALEPLPETLRRRARHVVTECERVLHGARALEQGDLGALAAILRTAHESLRNDFAVTVPELDLLAETAWAAPGAHGARAFGGGFGGCVVVVVEEEAAGEVGERLAAAFVARFARTPRLLLSDAGAGAEVFAGDSLSL